ncbi:MAG: OmpA family protein [Micavibrio sp.]
MVKIAANFIALGFVLMMLSACLATTTALKAPESGIDGQYAGMLAQQYQTMAALAGVNGLTNLSAHYQQRGVAAAAGQWVRPAPVPDTPADPELVEAHDLLLMSLTSVMNAENALWLARAQVNYDCWALTLDESCKSDFDKALRMLAIPPEALQAQTVYFPADSSALSPETRATLESIARTMRMHKMVNIRLTGSTDHATRNKSLALRRAIAVRNVLAQMGVSPDRISVEGEDHSDTILSQQNPENGGDPLARRVDIVMEPVYGQAI